MRDLATPADKCVARLLETGRDVACVESCTGGLVAAAITGVPGASAVFAGGIVVYSDSAKLDVLGVPESLVRVHGAVSAPVAKAMAEVISKKFGTAYGVSTTGFAGPGGGTDENPVGTVYFGIRTPERLEVLRARFSGDRQFVREQAVTYALEALHRRIADFAGR